MKLNIYAILLVFTSTFVFGTNQDANETSAPTLWMQKVVHRLDLDAQMIAGLKKELDELNNENSILRETVKSFVSNGNCCDKDTKVDADLDSNSNETSDVKTSYDQVGEYASRTFRAGE